MSADRVVLVSLGAVLLPRRRSLHGTRALPVAPRSRPQVSLVRKASSWEEKDGACSCSRASKGCRWRRLLGPERRWCRGPQCAQLARSLVCMDMKRENWMITAGFRARWQACYLFDPFAEDGRTARWNPFSYVSHDPARRFNDLQRIAEMLYPDPPGADPFWTASARSLF